MQLASHPHLHQQIKTPFYNANCTVYVLLYSASFLQKSLYIHFKCQPLCGPLTINPHLYLQRGTKRPFITWSRLTSQMLSDLWGLRTLSNWRQNLHISASWQTSGMGAGAELCEELLAGKKQRETRPERPEGLCGLLSLLLKEMILRMWALRGPERICLRAQRCGYVTGCHRVLFLHLYTLNCELWLTEDLKVKPFKLNPPTDG